MRTVTHLFNAMRHSTPRDPSIALAALARPDVTVQVIVDLHHVAPDTVTVAWHAASARFALVTDAAPAAGTGDGDFVLGGRPVRAADGVVRGPEGQLAGSALTMIEGVRNLQSLGVALEDALRAASEVPARIARRPDLGRLAPGAPADVVVLDDRSRWSACSWTEVNVSLARQEMAEQPAVLERLLRDSAEAILAARTEIAERRPRFGVIAARGSSDNAARYAQHLFGRRWAMPVGLATPSLHTLYDAPLDYSDALVIGISQSGASPDVAAVVETANDQGAVTIAITNEPGLGARPGRAPRRRSCAPGRSARWRRRRPTPPRWARSPRSRART